MTPFEVAKHPYSALKQIFRRGDDPLKGIILSVCFCLIFNKINLNFKPKLESQLRDVAITTSNTKRNYGLFRNVLLHGPPGTGKTMFAKVGFNILNSIKISFGSFFGFTLPSYSYFWYLYPLKKVRILISYINFHYFLIFPFFFNFTNVWCYLYFFYSRV